MALYCYIITDIIFGFRFTMKLILFVQLATLFLILSCQIPNNIPSVSPSQSLKPSSLPNKTLFLTPGPFRLQTDPFGGNFQDSDIVALNKETRILFQTKPMEDRDNATIKISLPFGLEYIRGELQWEGNLVKEQVVSLELFVKTTNKMQGNIKAEVSSSGKSPGVLESRSYNYPISTLEGNTAIREDISVK